MINVHNIRNGFFPSNTYLVYGNDSDQCIVIDPGLDRKAIHEAIDHLKLSPSHIVCTHGHFDHVGSVHYLQHKYNAPFYLHTNDSKIVRSINFFLKIMKIDMRVPVPIADVLMEGNESELKLGNFCMTVFNFPGHTEGSCILKVGNFLFTGDTLYSKGLGINPFPGQDKEKLRASLNKIVRLFNHDIMIYPGHGSAATLSDIRTNNIELSHFLEEVII